MELYFKWIWIPNIGVNEFLFKRNCSNYFLAKYELDLINIYEDIDNNSEFEYYSEKFGISIILLNNTICDRVEIWKNIYFNNVKIIGLSINELVELMQLDDIIEDKQGDFYQSEKVNALFWVEENIITSVSL